MIKAARSEDATPEDLLAAITSHRKWGDFPMDEEELLERFRALDRVRPRGAVRAFYDLYAAKQGKPRWGDKTPGYTMYMRRISRVLPEARFVHVIRDGRAVGLSRMRTLSLKPVDAAKVAKRWRKKVEKARSVGASLDGYLEIRYEALVTDPEPTLREVCEFIELPWDPALLDYHERSEERLGELDRDIPAWGRKPPRSAESRMALHQQTTKPPDPSRIDRWRTELEPAEIEAFEAEAGPLLKTLGYELTGSAKAS